MIAGATVTHLSADILSVMYLQSVLREGAGMDLGILEQLLGHLHDGLDFLTTTVGNVTGDQIKGGIGLLLGFLVIYTTLKTLSKLGMIRDVMMEFNKSRGPIWDLRGMIDDLQKAEPAILQLSQQLLAMTEKLNQVTVQLASVEDRVETARQQFIETQIERLSERSPEGTESVLMPADQSREDLPPDEMPSNWSRLQELWRRNTRRIEYVIDSIDDGRKRRAYTRMPRTNYSKIIDKLERAGLMGSGAANASRRLNDQFNAYRSISKLVPDEVIGPLNVLDKQLDAELVDYTAVESGEGPAAKIGAVRDTPIVAPMFPAAGQPIDLPVQPQIR